MEICYSAGMRIFSMLLILLSAQAVRAQAVMVKKVVSGFILLDSKVLLLKRSPEEIQFPNFYNLPGGKLDPDESEEDAIVREVREETGLNVSIIRSYNQWHWFATFKGQSIKFELKSFHLKIEGSTQVTLSDEHTHYTWASRQDLEHLRITPELRAELEIAFHSLPAGRCDL